MIYLDNAATTMPKPDKVREAVAVALRLSGSAGRSSHKAAEYASQTVYECRDEVAEMFDCPMENVVFTFNATHGLNIAIKTLVQKGDRVLISGFEHNAVLRPLYSVGAEIVTVGRKLFDQQDTIAAFASSIDRNTKAVICTHMSNAFGYILPVEEISQICKEYNVPLIVDAAQSAGVLPLSMRKLNAEYIAMPGHKGLFGPQGTGILLCKRSAEPLLEGGTGSSSKSLKMPEYLPDRLEAGTLNAHGIAGLLEGLRFVKGRTVNAIFAHEAEMISLLKGTLNSDMFQLFASNEAQGGVLSLVPRFGCCEEIASRLSRDGFAVRSGFHCSPLAHDSAGTYHTGTIRVSVSAFTKAEEIDKFCQYMNDLKY